MKRLLFVAFMLFFFWKLTAGKDSVVLGPGIKVEQIPLQTEIKKQAGFLFKGFRVNPMAEFQLKAKVLSKEDYFLGRESELSPVDLALGWGQMSDEEVLKSIDISQSGRWYHWSTRKFPIPRRTIETHSANMHMIPADDAVESKINKAKEGQIIALVGYLVRVDHDDGWHWQSSLTREDSGAGGCEVVFVTDFEIIE